LLQAGADVNAQNDQGYTPLLLTSKYSNTSSSVETVKVLLQAGADVNAPAKEGLTPLHLATKYSNTSSSLETVKVLLEYGANIDILDRYGDSPLDGAVINNLLVTANVLLEAGASPYKALSLCKSDTCDRLIYKYIWLKIKNNIDMLSSKYSKTGDFQLPKDIWKLILMRNKQRQLCKNLSNNRNKPILILFADMLNIPTHPDITKHQLCKIISKQLTWGGSYSEGSVKYFKAIEAKEKLGNVALLLGINTNQSIDKIIDDIGIYLNN